MATYSLAARKQILGDDARHHPDLLAVLLVRDLLDTGCDQLGLQVTSMQQVLDDLYVQKKGQRGRRLSISSSNLVAITIAFSSHLCERSPQSNKFHPKRSATKPFCLGLRRTRLYGMTVLTTFSSRMRLTSASAAVRVSLSTQ